MRFRLPRIGPLTKGVLTLSGGTAIAQAFSFLIYPVLTRYYEPDAFGFMAVYVSLVGIIVTASSLGYEQAIPLPKDAQGGMDVVGLSLYLNAGLAVLTGAIFAVCPSLMEMMVPGESVFRSTSLLIPFGVLLAGSYRVVTMWAVRRKEYRVISSTQVAQSISGGTIKLLGSFAWPSALMLIFATMASSGVGIGSVVNRTMRLRGVKLPSASQAWKTAKRFWRFALFGAPAGLINSLSTGLPALFMARFFSLAVAGQYSLTTSVIAVPIGLLRGSLSRVFFAEAGALGKDKPLEVLQLTSRFTKRSLLLILGPSAALAFFGPQMFSFVFGVDWKLAGQFAQFFSVFLIASLVTTPFEAIFYVFEKQHLDLALNVLKLALSTGSFVLPHLFNASATVAVASYTLSLAAYYLLYTLTSRVLLLRAARRE